LKYKYFKNVYPREYNSKHGGAAVVWTTKLGGSTLLAGEGPVKITAKIRPQSTKKSAETNIIFDIKKGYLSRMQHQRLR